MNERLPLSRNKARDFAPRKICRLTERCSVIPWMSESGLDASFTTISARLSMQYA